MSLRPRNTLWQIFNTKCIHALPPFLHTQTLQEGYLPGHLLKYEQESVSVSSSAYITNSFLWL